MKAWAAKVCRNFWRRIGLVARACLTDAGIKFVALMVSLGGAGIISFMLWGNLIHLRAENQHDSIFYLSGGMLLLIGVVLMSSHRLLGSKMALEGEFWKLKFKMHQGGPEEKAAEHVAEAAEAAVEKAVGEVREGNAP